MATSDAYQIGGTSVLNATTLGSAVVASSLTSVGTLTALQVDNININGAIIASDATATIDAAGDIALSADGGNVTMDDGQGVTVFDFDVDGTILTIHDDEDTGDKFSITVAQHGATTITTVDDDAAAAHLVITADGTVDIDSAATMTLDSGAHIHLEPASGSHILLDGTIQVDAGVVTGATSVTSTSFSAGTTVITDDSIVMTPSTNDTVTITAAANGALSITTVDTAAAAANIQITADGTAELAGTTVTLDSSGGITLDANGGTITFADDGASLGTITSAGYSGASATVIVTDSTANTDFPVVFHNESNGLLDDTGALQYNPSTGTLTAPNLVVSGTTTTVDTVTMNAANAIVFEGATADDYETTLTIVDPTADRTINLPNQSGTIPY